MTSQFDVTVAGAEANAVFMPLPDSTVASVYVKNTGDAALTAFKIYHGTDAAEALALAEDLNTSGVSTTLASGAYGRKVIGDCAHGGLLIRAACATSTTLQIRITHKR